MDAFLAEINLTQHATILDKLGYDDPNDFAEFEASDLKKLETRCADEGMPPAHVDKIVHLLGQAPRSVLHSNLERKPRAQAQGVPVTCTHGWASARPAHTDGPARCRVKARSRLGVWAEVNRMRERRSVGRATVDMYVPSHRYRHRYRHVYTTSARGVRR